MLDTSYLPNWLFTHWDIHLCMDYMTKFEILVNSPSLLFTMTSFTCAAHMSTNSTYTRVGSLGLRTPVVLGEDDHK